MKLWDEIEKDRRQMAREVQMVNALTDLADIFANLPDDVTIDKIDDLPVTGYVVIGIRIGNDQYAILRYHVASKTITVGTGGYLPIDKIALGAAFWSDPEVIRTIRIWMIKI